MDSQVRICRDCGASFFDENYCVECNSTNFALADELICVPVEGTEHFQVDRGLALTLKKYAGKKCKVRIQEL